VTVNVPNHSKSESAMTKIGKLTKDIQFKQLSKEKILPHINRKMSIADDKENSEGLC